MNSRFTLALPPDYCWQQVLAFHQRDREGVAEQASATGLRKALLLDGVALLLELDLSCAQRVACRILADSALSARAATEARTAALGALGLRLDPAPFNASVADDTLFGPLTRARPGLRVVQAGSVFEALSWAIMGQQIHLTFAIALRRSFIRQAGRQHSSGLWCYPDPAAAASLDLDALLAQKFSRAKAETLLRLARLVADGTLALELDASNSIERIAAALLAVKGIGPWTVNYALLRGYAYPDCALQGDAALRTALHMLLGEAAKPEQRRTEQLLLRYRPQRSMAAAHLWASLPPRAGAGQA